jgi:CheY-like chemotaxis protein
MAEDVETIAHEARRAAAIARQLLNLVRRSERPRESADLNDLVERTLKARAASFAAHGIQVSFTPAADLPPVSVVRVEIEQVLTNLLANAEQAMHAGRGQGRVRVLTRHVGGSVEAEVADNGPGIAPDHLAKLFEAFFTTKPVGIGTGLGLSIARRIARDHGGDLLAASAEGQGATFTLCLPAAVAAGTAAPQPRVTPHPSKAPGKRVLVVDDEPAVRQSVARILGGRGIEAVAAADAEAALGQLGRGPFDLVFCDVHLGERSGVELYQTAIQRQPDLQGRFVFMTGDVLSLDLQEFFASTGSRHLTKPFELIELLEHVERPVA